MKFQVVLLAVLFCLAAQAASKTSQSAPTANQSAPKAQQSLTGCVDEQNGQYVLLDDQMQKIANLHSTGSDEDVFAKHLGHKVQVTGTKSSDQKGTFTVTAIKRVPGECGQAN